MDAALIHLRYVWVRRLLPEPVAQIAGRLVAENWWHLERRKLVDEGDPRPAPAGAAGDNAV